LVTGGAGFIGSHLTDELLGQGYAVTVIDNLANGTRDNLAEAFNHEAFTFYEGDILNKTDCATAAMGAEYIFHLACLGVRHSIHSPFENHRVNAEGTLNVLDAGLKNKVKKFFYISSSEVYGKVKEFPIKETSLPEPLTVYGASKLVGEYYTNAYNTCYNLDTTVLRIFNNYGPRAHYEGDSGEIIPRTIVNLLYDKQPVIFGDGNITRDFFYVKDTARALAGLMANHEINGKTINIGTGVEITMKKLVADLMKLMGKEQVGIDFQEDRPADVPRLWVDNEKFKQLTGFEPAYSFEQGLAETIPYYENLMTEKDLISRIVVKNWQK